MIHMTLKEAYKTLGATNRDDERTIKTKYKKLLFMYHPDSDPNGKRDPGDDDKIRLIIEAYKKIRESEGEGYYEDDALIFESLENKRAFAERNVYIQLRIYDDDVDLPLTRLSRGRFIWDPDLEEFRLFTKSVLEAVKEVLADADLDPAPDLVKDLFHLMMLEYILPADAARKLGRKTSEDGNLEIYSFHGFSNNGISFDEDELYYVVLPLLEDPNVESRITETTGNRVLIELSIPKDLTDTPVSNGHLIKELLKGAGYNG